MKHILEFNSYHNLFEKIEMITANWSLVYREGSFEKKSGYGFFIFKQNGEFSIVYSKPEEAEQEESRIDFYTSPEASPDKKSVCLVRIIAKDGKNKAEKSFSDITKDNLWDIISLFFDYSDLEKIQKSEIDRFLMGFSKGIKEILKSDKAEELPPSFKAFVKTLKNSLTGQINLKLSNSSEKTKFESIIKSFVQNFKN